MSRSWLTGLLAGCLAGASPSPLWADDPLPLEPISFLLPKPIPGPQERPDTLPNIDPRLDIKPLIRPPSNQSQPNRTPAWHRGGPKSDYDPSYLFLPERNPGVKQPPCPCLPLGRYWVNTAYFLGKTQNDTIPALVTTGGSGIIGSTGTSVVHGNERLDHPFRSGFRLEAGGWIDRCQNWGIDGSFFFMQSTRANFEITSNGNPTLARPFVDLPGQTPAAEVLALNGVSTGKAIVDSPLTFFGADANSRHNLYCEDNVRLDFLAGYRFIRTSEQLNIFSQSNFTDGSSRQVDDSYQAVNLFNGGQVGLAGEYRFSRLYLAGSAKIAFGVNWSRLEIEGTTRSRTVDGTNTTVPGGLLTRPSNVGVTNDRNFAVVPEANFMAGYQIADHWRAYVGYTFVYVSNVARPGQAIDLEIGRSAVGVLHPQRMEANTDFWMHGINVGIEARY
ncbi:MAG: BBP7 family outer membrane beta-barrel protein [Planctomycetes bacterium]|nr:BBP7 family outer membrane beta-barrel protein [Planctomycetota bacterium]